MPEHRTLGLDVWCRDCISLKRNAMGDDKRELSDLYRKHYQVAYSKRYGATRGKGIKRRQAVVRLSRKMIGKALDKLTVERLRDPDIMKEIHYLLPSIRETETWEQFCATIDIGPDAEPKFDWELWPEFIFCANNYRDDFVLMESCDRLVEALGEIYDAG